MTQQISILDQVRQDARREGFNQAFYLSREDARDEGYLKGIQDRERESRWWFRFGLICGVSLAVLVGAFF